jgi:hypothetical protein
MMQMKKRLDLKLLSVLCVVVLVFLALSTFAFSAKKEKAEEWIGVEGDAITLNDVTITFVKDVLTKDTKIFIIDFGDGVYQFGPEIKIEDGKTFTIFFESLADIEVTWIETFKQGEWEKLECNYGEVVTNHFSRYRAFR